ncbi:hypothetical protein CY34DRAFT_805968 [Suillus luteus UH-Slu-Lm8-n1]|uniref:Unplaced genomic scaffold CY34scaffold_135, whole genome shotgun sequence n=1 Tax=Suillus luteus UH-Slu-Lm8-n1 TaxID=930992 RepID=A0A0C9ZUK0_9AGAM|nr:hypothetical protein CY34DRAFT_805968 [Suillus luteus UH-Slu-Lm8-n1]
MPSTSLESTSNKENINPAGCQGKRSSKKTKALPFAVMQESKSASTPRINPLTKRHAVCDQRPLDSVTYRTFVALDDPLFSQSADSRAKELTESPLAEVTDAFVCVYSCSLLCHLDAFWVFTMLTRVLSTG